MRDYTLYKHLPNPLDSWIQDNGIEFHKYIADSNRDHPLRVLWRSSPVDTVKLHEHLSKLAILDYEKECCNIDSSYPKFYVYIINIEQVRAQQLAFHHPNWTDYKLPEEGVCLPGCNLTLIGIQEGFQFTDFNGNIQETNGQLDHEGITYQLFKDAFSVREHVFFCSSCRITPTIAGQMSPTVSLLTIDQSAEQRSEELQQRNYSSCEM
jgi:hypothetical protein